MLLTTLGFLLLTTIFIVFHVRRSARAQAPARSAPRNCPRCHAPLAPGAENCAACQAPLQAFELVTARVVDGAEQESDGPLHAIVRADLCVGCGTCVDACPHPGAIMLVNKLATVDLNLCEGAASCAAACPVNAIAVTSGAAVQRVEAPDLTPNFESNIPGLYVVGELGGRGLIKNAINEGKLAIEHVVAQLPPGAPRADREPDALDVLIVGSGPAGLSAGLEAHARALRYLVLEQGSLSDTIRKYPRKKLLFAEPLRMPLYGDLWIADGSKEALLEVWTKVITDTGLRVRTSERVETITMRDGLFDVACEGGHAWRARRVVLAMGRRGTPRRLGVPGEALEKVLYDIIEMEAFAGQRMLVVGGGDSAIESALGLANQHGTTVTLSYRGTEFARVKDRNREKIAAAIAQKRVTPLLPSVVREIRPDVVVLEAEGRVHLLPNDAVIVRIGGEPAYPFLERLGIRIVRKEIALQDEPSSAAAGVTG